MADIANENPSHNLKLAAFGARCWARAQLWRNGAYGDTRDARALHCAVDALQHQAEHEGFLAAIGQDAVQACMAAAFREVREGPCGDLGKEERPPVRGLSESCPLGLCERGRCADPGFCAGARAADAAADAERARRAALPARTAGTPQTTIEAIMHSVRSRGLAALKEPATLERLSRCDKRALDEINKSIAKLGAKP
jgi:hypothetical protein